jgi:asparagine synthase (glutamine-hydrolysing)
LSGIVGIYCRDRVPVAPHLIEQLTEFLTGRGPDGSRIQRFGFVALGQTLLRTGHSHEEWQEKSIRNDGLAISADARIDCRRELQAQIRNRGRDCDADASASQLILDAYATWGEECTQHLRGDFAFAIWDEREQKLFCARDHFGIKPFYYADKGPLFICSNTLNCIRSHTDISDELNELALADFLLFGVNHDPAASSFRDIRRLPPAHTLTVSRDGLKIRRYWAPPIDGEIRYQNENEYTEHFQELLQCAVADRLPDDRAAILLSGGLDSGTVAATARALTRSGEKSTEIRAYTVGYELLMPDGESYHARNVASFLEIPIECISEDGAGFLEEGENLNLAPPEPTQNPFFSRPGNYLSIISPASRVAFSGEGSDNLLDFQMWPYVQHLAKKKDWLRLLSEGARFLKVRRFPWRGLQVRGKRLLGLDSEAPTFPEWIAPKFERRLNLRDRWREGIALPAVAKAHPFFPRGHASMALPQWAHMFETEDPGATQCLVETRYPFLDLRLVEFLFAVPPFPWAFEKTLIRKAMAGKLPETERLRRKTPLRGDPLLAMLKRARKGTLEGISWSEGLDSYVNPETIPLLRHDLLDGTSSERRGLALRPLCLNFWLRSIRRVRYK